jgi:hypothetical protein
MRKPRSAAVGERTAVLHDLLLQLAELFGLGQLEGQVAMAAKM